MSKYDESAYSTVDKTEITQGSPREVSSKSWPKNCIWPAPIDMNEGLPWDEDIIPDELDAEAQELMEIKDYFDHLLEEGFLNEDYSLNYDYESEEFDKDDYSYDPERFVPEMGEDYWDDGFDIETWREDLTVSLNKLKIEAVNPDPINEISYIIGYRFINENLLRQAFTRRAFQQEYHLSGCSEELEFMGDSILNLQVTKELMKHFTRCSAEDTDAPFRPKYDEGEFSRLKAKFICKEYLSKRCSELSLDSYILYATGEEQTDSACEDAIEAIIGAVAVDCEWDWDVLEGVIDKLLDLQIDKADSILKKSYYEIFNAWHQKKFRFMPEYEVYKNFDRKKRQDMPYYGYIKYCVPANNRGLSGQVMNCHGETRSQVRELLAELAYRFIVDNGLWMNLRDAKVEPELDRSINQLQEMFQKGYIDKAEYTFEREGRDWYCVCSVNDIVGRHRSFSKADAKKYAAYEALVLILKAADCCPKEWYDEMIKTTYVSKMNGANTVEYFPSKFPNGPIGLKYVGLVEVLNQIPAGRIITEKVLLKWLGEEYQMENLIIMYEEIPRPYAREHGIPFHRFLTAKGLVDECYVEALKAEGHDAVETKTTNWRVTDYKETMVDVGTLKAPDKEKAIGHAEHFLKFVNSDAREALERGMRERGFLK